MLRTLLLPWLCFLLLAVLAAACGDDGQKDDLPDAADQTGDLNGDVADDNGDSSGDVEGDAAADTDTDANMSLPEYLPESEPGRHNVELVETRQIIPGNGLPAEAEVGEANNNLDVVRHSDGRIYLAWRTAPDHFAGAETQIHVVSTDDEETWQYEATFERATDLREPRFLSLPDGNLFLYLAELGTNELSFDPQGMLLSERLPDGSWTELEDFYLPGYIPWRSKVIDGTPYMTAYVGGENIYQFNGEPLEIDFLTTEDGRSWTGVNPADATVSTGGGSETAFTIGDDGTLFAVIRNEAGDGFDFGSKVCTAPSSDISDWSCQHDPKKYDSPLMFWYDGEAYLIGRRNVTIDGHYDLDTIESGEPQAAAAVYQLEYSQERKRCSLWRYDQDTDQIVFLMDLPSRGDTCFPGLLEGEQPGDFIVYNYSSPIDGPDVGWNTGQKGETRIYRHVLRFVGR